MLLTAPSGAPHVTRTGMLSGGGVGRTHVSSPLRDTPPWERETDDRSRTRLNQCFRTFTPKTVYNEYNPRSMAVGEGPTPVRTDTVQHALTIDIAHAEV
jgi:hypothetical protein